MGKKSAPAKPGIGKIVAIIAGVLITAVVATQVYAAVSHDEDWELKSLLAKLNSIKNEPSGCCLPLCEAMGTTECGQRTGEEESPDWRDEKCSRIDECDKGCCQVDCVVKDLPEASCESMEGSWTAGKCVTGCCDSESGKAELPKKTCEECTGGTWKTGSCKPAEEGKAFSFHGVYEVTVPLAGYENASSTIKSTIDMSTCDGKYDGWSGTQKNEMSMTTKYGTQNKVLGEEHFSPGDKTYEVNGNMLKLRGIGPKGPFTIEAPITPGAARCN